MEKLKSRKFWMAVVGALLIVLNEGLGFGIDAEIVLAFAGLVMSYIFAEGYVDGQRAKLQQSQYLYAETLPPPVDIKRECNCCGCSQRQQE